MITDKDGDYFLTYYQRKMKKEFIVPISKDLGELILNHEKIMENKINNNF